MADSGPAVWSAVAASFAALSSFLIMLVQRRNLLESVRPELILTGWDRCSEGQADVAYEVIRFQTIKNVGRGAAFHIHLTALEEVANRPTAGLSTIRLPILGANEATDLDGRIVVFWKNVEPDDRGLKHLPITIPIFCLDSRGVRYETKYSLLAVPLSPAQGVTDAIAPGVMLGSRKTAARSVCLLRLKTNLRRVPLRFLRKVSQIRKEASLLG
jgi:hypothetical protein